MAIEGNHRPIPAKSGPSNRQRRNPAAAANPLPPAPASSTARPAIAQERAGHEAHMQKDQQQPRQPQHTQRYQHEQHFRHQQNRVGKRYRDKLTAGFESLQTTLGLDEEVGDEMDAADGAGRGGEGGGEGAQGDGSPMMGSSVDVDGPTRRRRRPLNKARIIDLTCERVRELVEEWEATRAEVEAMRRERALQGW